MANLRKYQGLKMHLPTALLITVRQSSEKFAANYLKNIPPIVGFLDSTTSKITLLIQRKGSRPSTPAEGLLSPSVACRVVKTKLQSLGSK